MEPVEQIGGPSPPPSIAKGKRTKRHRTHSPIPFTITTPTIINPVPSSSSSEQDSTTTEEEDTAKCLILLAQGHFTTTLNPYKSNLDQQHHSHVSAKVMYTCKTCNRAFTSFQALGGHRASHKKPKNDKRSSSFVFHSDEEDNFPSPSSLRNRVSSSSSLSLQLSSIPNTAFSSALKSPSPRIHECSYCGAEFTSGQALGGHMRRHRAGPVSPSMRPTPAPVAVELKSPRNVLSLDLNLPAPEDENQRFGFAGAKQPGIKESENEAASRLGLSTSSTATPKLVDCHY